MSHLELLLESRSLTHPLLLRQNSTFEPSGEKRGNQSTWSPLVICFTSEPSVFIVYRSWFSSRELDQTIRPPAFPPTSFIKATVSAGGASSAPLGGAPVREEQLRASRDRMAPERRRVR